MKGDHEHDGNRPKALDVRPPGPRPTCRPLAIRLRSRHTPSLSSRALLVERHRRQHPVARSRAASERVRPAPAARRPRARPIMASAHAVLHANDHRPATDWACRPIVPDTRALRGGAPVARAIKTSTRPLPGAGMPGDDTAGSDRSLGGELGRVFRCTISLTEFPRFCNTTVFALVRWSMWISPRASYCCPPRVPRGVPPTRMRRNPGELPTRREDH